MSGEHAPYSPSAMDRTWNCAGWILLSSGYVDKPNKYSATGSAAHAAAESILRRKLNKPPYPDVHLMPKFLVDGFEIRIDQKMLDAVSIYVDYVMNIVTEYDLFPSQVQLEEKVIVNDEIWGKPDCRITVPLVRKYVIDYKNGYGEVDVSGNKQLLTYALADWLSTPDYIKENIDEITSVVIQPNGKSGVPIKQETYTPADLDTFHRELLAKVEATKEHNRPSVTAGDWCEWCPAKLICPAFQEFYKLSNGSENVFPPESIPKNALVPINTARELPVPNSVTPFDLFNILSKKKQVNKWFDDAKGLVLGVLENGTDEEKQPYLDAGFGLVPKRSNRAWAVDEQVIFHDLIDAGVKHFMTEPKMLSPAKLEAKLKREKIKFPLAEYYEKPDNGYTLALGGAVEDDNPFDI